jgi:hypothetical protein
LIVTAHQPGFLPGLSVYEKVRQADAVIWLDDVQYEKGGWTNRNRMPDGSWLTVPLQRSSLGGPIRKVLIDYSRDWQRRHARTLRQHYGKHADPLIAQIECGFAHLASLNLCLLRVLLADADTEWTLQTSISLMQALPISTRLAAMVKFLGGDVYLSGPSGRKYLDEIPFIARGIEVRYFESPYAVNACSAGLLADVTPA